MLKRLPIVFSHGERVHTDHRRLHQRKIIINNYILIAKCMLLMLTDFLITQGGKR